MKTLLDIHNHTIASGHAYSTLQEMVHAAAERGLEHFGITDHGPGFQGSPVPTYFWNTPIIPREMYGVKLLIGCELNILNTVGELDLQEKYLQRLDVRIAGIHAPCWTPGTKDENTQGVLNVMSNPLINVISHPMDGVAELHMEPLVRASRETKTLLEINSSSLKPIRNKLSAAENSLEILRLSKKLDIPVILAADAHISFEIGNYEHALPLLQQAEFPSELVVNYHPELFFEFCGLPDRV